MNRLGVCMGSSSSSGSGNTHLRYAFMSGYDLKSGVTSFYFQSSFAQKRHKVFFVGEDTERSA